MVAERLYERHASAPSPTEMIRKGTRIEKRRGRAPLRETVSLNFARIASSIGRRSRSSLSARRGGVTLRQVGRDDLVDLLLCIRLELRIDPPIRPAPPDDQPQLSVCARAGEDLLELFRRRLRQRTSVQRDQPVAFFQTVAFGRTLRGDCLDDESAGTLLFDRHA